MRWERVRLEVGFGDVSSGPGKRWGHTCNAIKGGRFLYVFGGYGKDNCQTNQVHVFDTATQIWSQPLIRGTPPTPRDSHTSTAVGDNLFVFGGTDGMNPLKDLHILDTSSHTWICPSVRGEGPEAREGHSAALAGKRLFIFGGCGKSSFTSDEIYYNDLYILNTETFVWKRAVTTGNPPSPRDSHTCSSWKNKIIVIGGEDGHDYYLSDVHILDADTLFWKEMNTSGQVFSPRAGHSTVSFGRNIFVFGGFTDAQNLYDDLYVLDVETGVWSKVLTSEEGPSARFSVSGDCLDPSNSGVLVFFGGCNKNLEALDDMYYLYTGLASDYVRDERNVGSLSLKKQLKLKCQEQNLANSVYDRALVRMDMDAGRENFLLDQAQFLQGRRTFQANVTESLQLGYTIETIIDGKPLRGILFTNKPGAIVTPADQNLSRKRFAGNTGLKLNGDDESKSKTPKTLRQDSMGSQQADDMDTAKDSSSHGREAAIDPSDINVKASTSDETEAAVNASDVANIEAPESHGTQAVTAPDAKIRLDSDVFQADKEPLNTELSSNLLNLNDDQTNEAFESGYEVSKAVDTAIMECRMRSLQNQDETLRATNQQEEDDRAESAHL